MNVSVTEQYRAEVKSGTRFRFGSNWARFLKTLSDGRIAIAEQSLRTALGSARLDNRHFLDVGSGSGLFSLAARRLGASVRSFDFDPDSVACTEELKRRFFPNDEKWIVQQASVLDRAYLSSLGTFDIVYSWGVLHHTGQMWSALDNVKPLVRHGGQLYIAIYNDLGAVTDRWREIKRTYNGLPRLLQWPFAISIIVDREARTLISHLRHGNRLRDYIRQWTRYQTTRGMNKWYDWFDWIGGYPYECATIEDLIDFFSKDGFSLERLESRANGIGCNEVVFRRQADLGVFVDNLIPKSKSLIRRCGRRAMGPVRRTSAGYIAKKPVSLAEIPVDRLVLFRNEKLSGAAVDGGETDAVIVAPPDWSEQDVAATKFHVAPGHVERLEAPIKDHGFMFHFFRPDLKNLADNLVPDHEGSPVFLFEDGVQLPMPHSIHDDIAKLGAGRFSHWKDQLRFSSSDKSDPRTNARTYEIVIIAPEESVP